MNISSTKVGILACKNYHRQLIKDSISRIADAVSFSIPYGSKILIKPNLVSAMGHDGLACSHPEIIASVAEWCLDHGAAVKIGDSPALGKGLDVMQRWGIADAVKSLDVQLVPFSRGVKMKLAGGVQVSIASEVPESDILINAPRLKAHSQLGMTIGVKNFFGIVKGWRKAFLHQSVGGNEDRFAEMIVDLLEITPPGMTILDGIMAMHKSGPLDGDAYHLGILAGSINPVALDTALLQAVQMPLANSQLWKECRRRNLRGSEPEELQYPFLSPEEVKVSDFLFSPVLKPIRFNLAQVRTSISQRLKTKFYASP